MFARARAYRYGMLFLSKTRALAFAAALVLLLAACVPLSLASRGAHAASFCVVIDAGHGGVDAGVLGVRSEVRESDLNLQLARLLRERFARAGFCTVLTRTGAGGLYGLPTPGYKKRDMQRRKEIIESASPNLVLSVHQNFFPADPARRGGQVFYRLHSREGEALAASIQQQLNALWGTSLSALAGDYFMLNCTPYLSVIVECGFLSNAQDEAALTDAAFRSKLADAVFAGALAYFA